MHTDNAGRAYNVIFLCTGNSARSIMAEAILNRVGKGRFKAFSAGAKPKGEINPHALALLERLDFATTNLRSKSWDEFGRPDSPDLDFIFTVCDGAANEICPVWPGHPATAHWSIPDPATAHGNETEVAKVFRRTFLMLERRISVFAAVKHLERLLPAKRRDDEPASLRERWV